MTDQEIQDVLNRISNDDKYLMFIAELLVDYVTRQNNGSMTNPKFKAMWKGHLQFLSNVCKWYETKKYLTNKQHDAVLKTVKKYIDRVSIIFEMEDTLIDTGSEVSIFGLDEFEAKCPLCGSREFHCKNAEQTDLTLTYTCHACGFKATYNGEEDDASDVPTFEDLCDHTGPEQEHLTATSSEDDILTSGSYPNLGIYGHYDFKSKKLKNKHESDDDNMYKTAKHLGLIK